MYSMKCDYAEKERELLTLINGSANVSGYIIQPVTPWAPLTYVLHSCYRYDWENQPQWMDMYIHADL